MACAILVGARLSSNIPKGFVLNIVEQHYPEKTILQWTFPQTWSEQEYEITFLKILERVHQLNHEVVVIADLTNSQTIPLSSVFYFKKAARHLPDNVHSIILVGTNRYITFMVKAFSRLYNNLGDRITFAETIEVAQQIFKDKKTNDK